jgi:hypothetical protein
MQRQPVSPAGPGSARRRGFLVFLLAAAGLAFVIVTAARLPDVAATRFDLGGAPNAFITRQGYRWLMGILVGVVPLFVAFLPALIGARWPQLLNIPNRDHWLAPERRAQTLASVESRTMLLAAAMIAFMCFTHWLVLEANAADPMKLAGTPLVLGVGAFLAFVTGWIVALHMRFRR